MGLENRFDQHITEKNARELESSKPGYNFGGNNHFILENIKLCGIRKGTRNCSSEMCSVTTKYLTNVLAFTLKYILPVSVFK